MKSRLLAGVAAVVLAVVGAILVVSYASGADARAVKNLEPLDVLIVAKPAPAGTSVESLLPFLTSQKLPGTAVAKSALASLDGQAGKVTAVDLLPGEQLVAERLAAPETIKSSGGAIPVPEGLAGNLLPTRAPTSRRRPTGARRSHRHLHLAEGRRHRGHPGEGDDAADPPQSPADRGAGRPNPDGNSPALG